MLSSEFRRLFRSRQLYAALLAGFAAAFCDVVQNARDAAQFSRISPEAGFEGYSLFARWMGINGFTFGHVLFYLLWPLLAALPFGWAYASDLRSGYWRQIVTRAGRGRAVLARYLAVFTGGGLAVMLPLLADLLVNALICPACALRVTSSLTAVVSGHFLSGLFYTRPWLWSLIWCGVSFLWGGAAAVICLGTGRALRRGFAAVLSPLALMLALDLLLTGAAEAAGLELSPYRLASPAALSADPLWLVLAEIAAISALSLAGFWIQERKNELYQTAVL